MERELTVKVNYVLGNNSAFTEAGQQAAQVNQQVGKVGESFISKMQSHFGGAGSMAMRMLSGGLGSVAGIGLAGSIAGNINSDIAMGGGSGLRGHGLSGLGDSFMAMATGRATREALIDQKLQQGGFIADMAQTSLGSFVQQTDISRSTHYNQSTQVDPYKRIEEERALMEQRQFHAKFDYQRSIGNQDAMIGEMNKHHDGLKDNNTVQGKIARNIDVARIEGVFAEVKKKYAAEELQRATEINNLDKKVFEERKAQMRGTALNFGSMTHAEAQSAKIAKEQLLAGKDLMPEQVSMLGNFPGLEQTLNKYKMKKARELGVDDMYAGVDSEIGRATDKSRREKAAGVGGDPEYYLDSKEKFDASEKMKRAASGMFAEMVAAFEGNVNWMKSELQRLMQERQRQGNLQ